MERGNSIFRPFWQYILWTNLLYLYYVHKLRLSRIKLKLQATAAATASKQQQLLLCRFILVGLEWDGLQHVFLVAGPSHLPTP